MRACNPAIFPKLWSPSHNKCQELVWWTIASYFAEHAPESAKKKCKNLAQKKKYVTDVLKMPLQFDRWVGLKVLSSVDLHISGGSCSTVGFIFQIQHCRA